MMQSLISSPNPASRVQKFLDLVDRVSQQLGRNVPPIVDIEMLRSLPLGTFGRTWADALDQHQLLPFTTGPRRKQLHDGIHILTGYGTDPIGEAEVQAFLLGAKFRLLNLFIGLGLLRIIHKQLSQEPSNQRNFSWERLWNAYQRGRNSQFDPNTWQPEQLWDLPLTQVQALFRI